MRTNKENLHVSGLGREKGQNALSEDSYQRVYNTRQGHVVCQRVEYNLVRAEMTRHHLLHGPGCV